MELYGIPSKILSDYFDVSLMFCADRGRSKEPILREFYAQLFSRGQSQADTAIYELNGTYKERGLRIAGL